MTPIYHVTPIYHDQVNRVLNIPDVLVGVLVGQGRFTEAKSIYAKLGMHWNEQYPIHRQALKVRAATIDACSGRMDLAAAAFAEVIESPRIDTANLITAMNFFNLVGDTDQHRKCLYLLLARFADQESKDRRMDMFYLGIDPALLSQTPQELLDMTKSTGNLLRLQLALHRREKSDLEVIRVSRNNAFRDRTRYVEMGFPGTQAIFEFCTALGDAALDEIDSARGFYERGVDLLRKNPQQILAEATYGFGSPWLLTHVLRQRVEAELGLPVLPLEDFSIGGEGR